MAETLPERVLDSLPDPILLIDGARAVTGANRAARTALGVEPRGQDLAGALRHPDVLKAADAVLAGAPRAAAEITLPESPPRIFAVHAAGIEGGGEGYGQSGPRAILVFSDITAGKSAERMRTDFVANASHELRSPLSALLGFIETLRGPALGDAEAAARFLDIMDREARRMARLIDDLMSLSKVETDEHIRPQGRVNLALVIQHAADTLAQKAAERGVTITADIEPGLADAPGDADQLVQVARNLIENAVHYGRADSDVTVTVRRVQRIPDIGGAGFAVAVADRGDGIPAEAASRLTERFYRVDEARSQSLGSTGLGLAIVKHIVNRHRGRLVIESEPGEGSVFTVYLPAGD
ncbi:MAG: ATP-binding protein [Rhodospirillales bacterium]